MIWMRYRCSKRADNRFAPLSNVDFSSHRDPRECRFPLFFTPFGYQRVAVSSIVRKIDGSRAPFSTGKMDFFLRGLMHRRGWNSSLSRVDVSFFFCFFFFSFDDETFKYISFHRLTFSSIIRSVIPSRLLRFFSTSKA